MKRQYLENGYAFILSSNHDKITKAIYEYMEGIGVPCKHCYKVFLSKETRKSQYQVIQRTEK